MPKLSPARAGVQILSGLGEPRRGKARDTYALGNGLLLQVVTDGISIFDFVLNMLVPMKGAVLAAMSVFWFKKLEAAGFKTHLVAYGAGIDEYLPKELRGDPDLQSRALVVRECKMVPVEFVYRLCGTGSLLDPEKRCGHSLPDSFQDGDILPQIIDTPTSKEDEGHDLPLNAAEIRTQYSEQTEIGLRAFRLAIEHAARCGIVLADTKFEIGMDGTLADEVLTPDSSRYWLLMEWEASRLPETGRRAPNSFDKQRVREWGKLAGISKLEPKIPKHVEQVHAIPVPLHVVSETTQTYLTIFDRIVGMNLEQFQRTEMGIVA